MKLHSMNKDGFTLLEVLASIVILSIVIVSFLSLFPQMELFNKNTKDNLDSVTIAKELLVEMKPMEYTEIITLTKIVLSTEPSIELTTDPSKSTADYLVLGGEYRNKYINVTINRKEETYQSENLDKHEMKIEVFESEDHMNPSSTIYGFIRH